eukprot:TRINITY_DN22223_c0_g1_i1.p1 TRINITY_DN22223_c0_g1~~TRINITY_DN22223_c0_g1_i1.p1  ORF type:complete len:400 (+),score=91.65 TRINITY_DN22223_c0_g1_i1:110-1309(+)
MPFNAYIVDACRTAVGKRNGTLKEVSAVDLGAIVVDGLIDRTGIDGAAVDDVIFGCVSQIGAQAANLARFVCLASKKLPESVPGVTVDRQCGSSQQAIHFAAQAVMSGVQDVVIAGGAENMSQIPIGSNVMDGASAGRGIPYAAEGFQARYPGKQFSQFEGAELLAAKWGISREELDRSASESHARAYRARADGVWKSQIVPVTVDGKTFEEDEGIRYPSPYEKLAKMRSLHEGGRLTAATASQISDGAAAVLVVNERGLQRLGLKPRARIASLAVVGDDPEIMLQGPIPASFAALKRLGLSPKDIDLAEVNEAFASVPLSWRKALAFDYSKLNVNGGAMALGHPLGATGAKLMTQLVNELERRQGRYGILAICEGGGTANATIIERCTAPIPLQVPKL